MNPLKALSQLGQSVWLDFLAREFLDQHGLERLIEQDGLGGVTSNPSIFEKAIGATDHYDADIQAGLGRGTLAVGSIYEALAVADIRRAADILRPVYQRTQGVDGFVSLEVSPHLALNTEATIAEARRLWNTVDRPNVMIKVPATSAGLPAIRRLLSEGLNINITLLFAQQVYEGVVEDYLAALEELAAQQRPLARVASVASFFVSRIDAVVDRALEIKIAEASALSEREALANLKGKVAIANAKLAYQVYLRRFSGARWDRLHARGARPQRLLWASTGTKNPAYPDTLYVDQLIGPATVNTMPQKTMDAFRDHGKVLTTTLTQGVQEARQVLAQLAVASISLEELTSNLVNEGVRLFADAFDELLGAVARKRQRMLGPRLNGFGTSLGPSLQADVHGLQESWRTGGNVRRMWSQDARLWTADDESRWLGWLDVIEAELRNGDQLRRLQQEVRAEGFADAVLLGMGGSSLGPEVLARTLGSRQGFPTLHVLASTDPGQIRELELRIPLERTLFIVSSKSGSTLELNILMDYFFARLSDQLGNPRQVGSRFIAITDPGSALDKVAEERGFRQVFFGLPGIGGRYSVLSRFGLVPLAVMGRDIREFLEVASIMARSCGPEVPPRENPGVSFGLVMGALAAAQHDKLTIVASPSVAAFGAWAEQLVAESTGKQGKGIIPIDAEPLAAPSAYGSDRLFVYLRDDARFEPDQDRAMQALERSGQPLVRISLACSEQLAQEFFRWEIATAVAGAVIGVNPFNQPDVEASKVATRELSQAYAKTGSLPAEVPVFDHNGVKLFADEANAKALKQAGAGNTLESWLRAHFARAHTGDYFALLAYISPTPEHERVLQELRAMVLTRKRVATCLGFGPRSLHSTGQAYKGGPATGVFLQITAEEEPDVAIPGDRASFGVVKAAQARGDFQVLAGRRRRVLRAHISRELDPALSMLKEAASRAL